MFVACQEQWAFQSNGVGSKQVDSLTTARIDPRR